MLHGRFNGRRGGLCIFTSRTAWMKRVCQMFPTFSRKFIIRFFDLVNCLILLHRIFIIYAFNKLLRNISEIFCKYFAIQEKLYRLKETVNHFITSLKFQQLYLSIHQITLLTFFHSSNFSFRTTRTPNNIQNHQYHRFTDHIQQLFSFTLIYIHSIEQLKQLISLKEMDPPSSINPLGRVSRPRDRLITALYKPGTSTIEKFRMARITPSKAAPCGCDTWPGQGCAALVDAIAPLYACAHWKPMHITLKAITSPRRPVIIASLACSTREARVDCVMT